jgi:hypothetical protein
VVQVVEYKVNQVQKQRILRIMVQILVVVAHKLQVEELERVVTHLVVLAHLIKVVHTKVLILMEEAEEVATMVVVLEPTVVVQWVVAEVALATFIQTLSAL